MSESKKTPIRMCVVCRMRDNQHHLIRLQWENRANGVNIMRFMGVGRSFYLCRNCIKLPTVALMLCKKSRVSSQYQKNIAEKLKEICIDG